MIRKQRLPELLAPAGDFDALVAALLGGADAVYLGGMRFGARAYAKNFDDEQMARAVATCHLFGARLYVTVNTLIYDREMDEAVEYAKKLHGMGVDAVIIADLGLLRRLRREVPGLELHASTQMGVHNLAGADMAYELGCSRVVLARECSAEDIEAVTAKCKAEVEVFVHGALCVCHSGQCLFSSMIGGRSGNRGECAQPCRLPYGKEGYALSLKDLSLASHIKRLISSGVSSLKIEGRMKSPAYVYEVTRIYRALLDGMRAPTREEEGRLAAVFSRGGFTDGYFLARSFAKMTGVRSEADKDATRRLDGTALTLPRVPVFARCSIMRDKPTALSFTARITSRWDGKEAEITSHALGDIPNEAINAPLSEDGVKARLAKLGSTPFELRAEDISLTLDSGLNLSPAQINAIRRAASDALVSALSVKLDALIGEEKVLPEQKEIMATVGENAKRVRTVLFLSADTYSGVIKKRPDLLSGADSVFLPLFSLPEDVSGIGAYLPPVIMQGEWDEVKATLIAARERGVKEVLAGNLSHLLLARECGVRATCDFRLNVSNRESRDTCLALGAERIILSPELTLPMARDIGGGVTVLGRIPLMLTERCFIKENFGCEKCGKACLTDRMNEKFPLMREWKHRNLIMNSQPTYMGDKRSELASYGIRHEHIIISAEGVSEACELMHAYNSGARLSKPHRRVGKR